MTGRETGNSFADILKILIKFLLLTSGIKDAEIRSRIATGAGRSLPVTVIGGALVI